jgi:hypothetical protein
MFTLEMRLGGWGRDTPPEDIAAVVRLMIEALATANLSQFRSNPFPALDTGAIRYDVEESRELFDDATLVTARRSGDCDDLAAYRLAELWHDGEAGARALVRYVPSLDPRLPAPWLFHALIRRADGTIEDPSRDLGMGWLVDPDPIREPLDADSEETEGDGA